MKPVKRRGWLSKWIFLPRPQGSSFRLGVQKFLGKDNVVSAQSCFHAREA
jgi:hypothetical protein